MAGVWGRGSVDRVSQIGRLFGGIFFFSVVGLELKAYTLSHSTSPFL
jgi:hypothetical protein